MAEVTGSRQKYANERLDNTVATIAVAPVTPAEYKTVFGQPNGAESTTAAQDQEIQGVQAALIAKFGTDHGERDFTERNFKRVLQSKKASFVIVIGHNEDGRIRLLDGGSLYLDEIVANARENQRVILISCDSASSVSDRRAAGTINRKVTYADAFDIADRINAFIRGAAGTVSLADVQSQLSKDERIAKTHKVAFFIMKATCIGTAAILVALIIRKFDPCKDRQKSDCS